MTDDTHLMTSCEMYGHLYEEEPVGHHRCADCGDEYDD